MRIAHEYEEFVGVHNWEYWDLHVQKAIEFHVRNFEDQERKGMLDVKRHVRLCPLWETTVFAPMAGSITDRSLDDCVHHAQAT